jgi:hypothetical protein
MVLKPEAWPGKGLTNESIQTETPPWRCSFQNPDRENLTTEIEPDTYLLLKKPTLSCGCAYHHVARQKLLPL